MTKERLFTLGSCFLALCIVWPLFDGDTDVFAKKTDVVTFSEILKPKVSTQTFLTNFDKATEKVQSKIDSLDLGFDVDVEGVVNGDMSSLANNNLSTMEQLNLANLIMTSHDAAFQAYNTATRKATETAYINQIANSSFGDSMQDIKAQTDATKKIINSLNQKMDVLNKFQKGISMALGAKESFMQEKYDYPTDTNIICNNYMPGGTTQIFPLLFQGTDFKTDYPEYESEDVSEEMKSTANLDTFMDKQYQGLSNPDFKDTFEKGDLTTFVEEGGSALELAQQGNIAHEEAEELIQLNRQAEVFEKELQALELYNQEMEEQYDNYRLQTVENFNQEVLNDAILNAVEQAKPPTT